MSLAVSVMIPASATGSAEDIASFARHVEDVGLDGVFVGDHLSGTGPDSTQVLVLAAAATTRIAVGFGVMQVALRHPVWAAKQVATLQLLSHDRVVLGVGVGAANPQDWHALDLDPGLRGRLTDHALTVLPELITARPGAIVPTILVGGNSTRARRRVVDHGTGWFPSMIGPTDLAAGISEIHDRSGRDDLPVAVGAAALLGHSSRSALAAEWTDTAARTDGIDAAEFLVTGDPDAGADALARFHEAGADHVVLGLVDPDWRTQCEFIARASQATRTDTSVPPR